MGVGVGVEVGVGVGVVSAVAGQEARVSVKSHSAVTIDKTVFAPHQ